MRAREEKIQHNTGFLKNERSLRKCIAAALLGTMLASAVMGQTVYAEENVPYDGYVVEHGETFDNNDKKGVTNIGTIKNNTDVGRVETNNGTIINNKGDVDFNYGTVTNNYNELREIYENYGIVTNNYDGGVVSNNMETGTVMNNNNGGEVTGNRGTITNNNIGGEVYDNQGTVTNNSGTVNYNSATIDTNQSTGIVESNSALVKTNYGTVDNGIPYNYVSSTDGAVDMNYGIVNTKDNYSGYVVTNFGTVNGANNTSTNSSVVTIINNYGEGVTANKSTVNISNQFYSVDLTNTANSNLTHTSGFQTPETDPNSKHWLQTTGTGAVAGVITLTPDSGYEISGDDATDAAGASETKTFTYSVQKQADGSAVITISSPSGNINVDASTFGLVIQLIQQSTGGGGGGPVTVIVNNDDNDDDNHSYNNYPSSEPESYNGIPDGAIIISFPGTTASTAVATAGPAVLGAGRTPARVVKLKVSELSNAQFKEAVISNINATPAGGLLLIETDRIGTFDIAMLEAFAMKGNVDMEVLFPLGKNKISVTIPAGTDINKLLDDKGYCGFLRLLAILGGKPVTK